MLDNFGSAQCLAWNKILNSCSLYSLENLQSWAKMRRMSSSAITISGIIFSVLHLVLCLVVQVVTELPVLCLHWFFFVHIAALEAADACLHNGSR